MEQEMVSPPAGAYITSFTIYHVLPDLPGDPSTLRPVPTVAESAANSGAIFIRTSQNFLRLNKYRCGWKTSWLFWGRFFSRRNPGFLKSAAEIRVFLASVRMNLQYSTHHTPYSLHNDWLAPRSASCLYMVLVHVPCIILHTCMYCTTTYDEFVSCFKTVWLRSEVKNTPSTRVRFINSYSVP